MKSKLLLFRSYYLRALSQSINEMLKTFDSFNYPDTNLARPMKTKITFCYKIAHDAFRTMSKILRNPEVTGEEINGALCRITSSHDVLLGIQSSYWAKYKDDELVSVRLEKNDAREFVVLKSLLNEIEGEND